LPEKVTPEQATAILKQAEQDKIDACGDEVEKVMARFGCIMEPQIIIRGTRIFAQMVIVSNPTPNKGTQMQKIGELETQIAAQEKLSDEEKTE
jgi:hypothetical protein